jgi:hypothetical protein
MNISITPLKNLNGMPFNFSTKLPVMISKNAQVERAVLKFNWYKSLDGVLQFLGRYYVYTLVILQIVYVLIFIGLVYINPLYLTTFNILIQSFVCIFLLIRFHPYREHHLREYDSKIIFSSALFLLVNLGFVETFRNIIKNDLSKIENLMK